MEFWFIKPAWSPFRDLDKKFEYCSLEFFLTCDEKIFTRGSYIYLPSVHRCLGYLAARQEVSGSKARPKCYSMVSTRDHVEQMVPPERLLGNPDQSTSQRIEPECWVKVY